MSASQEWPDWLPLNERLKPLSPYGAPQIENVVSLNTNENPFELPTKVVDRMSERVSQILPHLNRYPDRDATKLRMALAHYLSGRIPTVNIHHSRIFAANGSNEILQTLALSFGDRGAIGFLPSYSMHPLIAQGVGIKWSSGQRNADFSLSAESAINEIKKVQPSLVFITTPNNPTGHPVTIEDIAQIAQVAQEVKALLVVDEAYAEFSQMPSAITLIDKYPNVVVVRTMSKAFSLAGARVGYIYANEKVIDGLMLTRLPYHLSSQTQAIALAALESEQELLAQVDYLVTHRELVADQLREWGFTVHPSAANFLLFSGFRDEPKTVWQGVLQAGVLIRDVGIAGHLRVTIGTQAENQQFLAAIQPFAP